MKKLFNKTTGQEAKIIKINVDNNHIVYSIYDASNPLIESSQDIVHKFSDYQIREDLYKRVNIAEKCLENLATEKLEGFVLEADNQNWVISTRPIRLFIPKNWLIEEVLVKPEHADLAYVINREQQLNTKTEENYVINGEKYLVAYFNSVDNTPNADLGGKTDMEVLQPYMYHPEMNVEGKLIMEQKETV